MADPLHFEDLKKGDRWISPPREVRRDDVLAFAELTGDHDPLHVDEEFAKRSPFRQPVAHGLLGLSILAGLSSTNPLVATLAFTDVNDWQFKQPIFFGDIVHAETEIVDVEQHGRRAGRVTWYRQLVNQNDVVTQQGSLITIVAARDRLPKRTISNARPTHTSSSP